MEGLIAAAFLILAPLIATSPIFETPESLYLPQDPTVQESDFIQVPISVDTQTVFEEQELSLTEEIPFETKFEEDPEKEWGTQEVTQEGKPGTKTLIYKIAYWNGDEIERLLTDTLVVPPQEEIIASGTKIVIRELDTDLGRLYYYQKLQVWAMSYDGNCPGCRGLTATGKRVTHGICAVDPAVIPLGTNFYVPGYGICRSEDTGGAIKGNKIDLGFEDVSQGWWSSRYVEIYLLR